MSSNIRRITFAALTAAAYAGLTIALAPISFGVIQFRLSEILCILPFFIPFTSWGLFIGCLIANLFTGNVYDMVFGSLATLIAASLTLYSGKHEHKFSTELMACLAPVITNTFIIGFVLTTGYNGLSVVLNPDVYLVNSFQIFIGEAAVMLCLGFPLIRCLERSAVFHDYCSRFF